MQEMSTYDMIKCLNNILNLGFKISKQINEYSKQNCNLSGIENIYKELYKRFIVPFYVPILILIALLLIIKNKENKNYSRYKWITFLIGFLTIIFSESTLKMIKNNFFENLNLVILPLLITIIFYFFYFYIFKFRFIKKLL